MSLVRTLIDPEGVPAQQRFADLAIVACLNNRLYLVLIAWPSEGGRPLQSVQVQRWLRERRLVWRCLCPVPGANPTLRQPASFHEHADSSISVECSNGSSGCGFQLDLDRIRLTRRLGASDYPHLVPGQSDSQYDQSMLLHSSPERVSPFGQVFYRGFCGDFQA